MIHRNTCQQQLFHVITSSSIDLTLHIYPALSNKKLALHFNTSNVGTKSLVWFFMNEEDMYPACWGTKLREHKQVRCTIRTLLLKLGDKLLETTTCFISVPQNNVLLLRALRKLVSFFFVVQQ